LGDTSDNFNDITNFTRAITQRDNLRGRGMNIIIDTLNTIDSAADGFAALKDNLTASCA